MPCQIYDCQVLASNISDCIVGQDDGCVANEIPDGGRPSGSATGQEQISDKDEDTSADSESGRKPESDASSPFRPLPAEHMPAAGRPARGSGCTRAAMPCTEGLDGLF